MKKDVYLLYLLILFIVYSCSSSKDSQNLRGFVQNYNKELDLFKVVFIIPAGGCGECIGPFINYAGNKKENILLVISSYRRKEVNDLIANFKIKTKNIILDHNNLASKSRLVSTIAPSIYFIKDGHVIRKFDTEKTLDKTSILNAVLDYLVIQ